MNNKKESLESARKSPEATNPFGMMRRFTRDMERLFEDFEGFRFPSLFNSDDVAVSYRSSAKWSGCPR